MHSVWSDKSLTKPLCLYDPCIPIHPRTFLKLACGRDQLIDKQTVGVDGPSTDYALAIVEALYPSHVTLELSDGWIEFVANHKVPVDVLREILQRKMKNRLTGFAFLFAMILMCKIEV